MRVKFWGTRGSIPVATDVGGHPTEAGGRADPGRRPPARHAGAHRGVRGRRAGLGRAPHLRRQLVVRAARRRRSVLRAVRSRQRRARRSAITPWPLAGGEPAEYHVFMSHTHWDHIMGFPFFMPAYIPGNVITIYGCHAWLEEAIRRQHGAPSFPVEFAQLGAEIRFVRLEPDRPYDLAGFRVTAKRQRHTGDSYGYRFERDGRSRHLLHRLRAQARRSRRHPRVRRVLPRRRPRHLRRAVLAGRLDLDQGGLGPLEQRGRRRAVPDGAGPAPLHVSPRADLRRREDRRGAGRDPAARGDHARRPRRPGLGGLGRNGDRSLVSTLPRSPAPAAAAAARPAVRLPAGRRPRGHLRDAARARTRHAASVLVRRLPARRAPRARGPVRSSS